MQLSRIRLDVGPSVTAPTPARTARSRSGDLYDKKLLAAGELGRYSALLRGAGYRVLADPEDDDVLEVWLA